MTKRDEINEILIDFAADLYAKEKPAIDQENINFVTGKIFKIFKSIKPQKLSEKKISQLIYNVLVCGCKNDFVVAEKSKRITHLITIEDILED